MRHIICLLVLSVSVGVSGIGIDDADILRRGDANHDGAVNVSDASYITSYLYRGGPAPPCMNEADANHDGQLTGADASYLLNWLYQGGPAPPYPGPYNTTCVTTTPYISCADDC